MNRPNFLLASVVALIAGGLGAGCEQKPATGPVPPPVPVSIIGSDLMVEIAQTFSESAERKYGIKYEVMGGGSSVGISALGNGSAAIACVAREVTDDERLAIRAARGKELVAHQIGWDANAVWVNSANPIEEISIPDLGEIFADGGSYNDWSQVSVKGSGGIVSFMKSSCSGIRDGFRLVAMKASPTAKGYRDYRPMRGAGGSKEIVDLCAETPGGIGYTRPGYASSGVKALRVSRDLGETAVEATQENVENGSYPLAVSLYLYTAGEPTGDVKKFIDFVRSAEGRKLMLDDGMFPADAATK